MKVKTFGIKLKGKSYKDRIGAYAIIFNRENRLATVKTKRGYFLIGGGMEEGETFKECLKRECLEETGYDIEIKNLIGKVDKYYYAELLGYYFHPTGYFYIADLKNKVTQPIEKNLKLTWIDLDEFEGKIYLDHQRWAVKEALKNRAFENENKIS